MSYFIAVLIFALVCVIVGLYSAQSEKDPLTSDCADCRGCETACVQDAATRKKDHG